MKLEEKYGEISRKTLTYYNKMFTQHRRISYGFNSELSKA